MFEGGDDPIGIRRWRGFADHAEVRTELTRNFRPATSRRANELLGPLGVALEVDAANHALAVKFIGRVAVVEAARLCAGHDAGPGEAVCGCKRGGGNGGEQKGI